MLYNINQRLNGFFYRSDSVIAMTIENIKILQPCPAQTLIDACHQVLAGAVAAIRPHPHIMAGFGGDYHLIPVSLEVFFENPSEISFGTSRHRTIVISKIEMGDAMVESIFNHVGRYTKVIYATEVMPQS